MNEQQVRDKAAKITERLFDRYYPHDEALAEGIVATLAELLNGDYMIIDYIIRLRDKEQKRLFEQGNYQMANAYGEETQALVDAIAAA